MINSTGMGENFSLFEKQQKEDNIVLEEGNKKRESLKKILAEISNQKPEEIKDPIKPPAIPIAAIKRLIDEWEEFYDEHEDIMNPFQMQQSFSLEKSETLKKLKLIDLDQAIEVYGMFKNEKEN